MTIGKPGNVSTTKDSSPFKGRRGTWNARYSLKPGESQWGIAEGNSRILLLRQILCWLGTLWIFPHRFVTLLWTNKRNEKLWKHGWWWWPPLSILQLFFHQVTWNFFTRLGWMEFLEYPKGCLIYPVNRCTNKLFLCVIIWSCIEELLREIFFLVSFSILLWSFFFEYLTDAIKISLWINLWYCKFSWYSKVNYIYLISLLRANPYREELQISLFYC